jgi:lipoprotein-anchoring transpeptidase ErfK/SrfK
VRILYRHGYRASVRALLVIVLASAVAGCGGGSADDAAPTPAPPSSTPSDVVRTERSVASCDPSLTRPLGSERRSYAAVVQQSAVAYRTPGGRRFAAFGRKNVNGVPNVFAVRAQRLGKDCKPTWFFVQLPLKPNGVTGWVHARDVSLEAVTTRVVVDLSDREVTLFDRGRHVLSAPAAIGAPATPTPVGHFYVNQRLIPADASGPFGPGAVGISAFSEVLTGWAQGGPIAIHGTNRPDLIGGAVSNGCIRVRNDLLQQLFDRTRSGTPVTVRA